MAHTPCAHLHDCAARESAESSGAVTLVLMGEPRWHRWSVHIVCVEIWCRFLVLGEEVADDKLSCEGGDDGSSLVYLCEDVRKLVGIELYAGSG